MKKIVIMMSLLTLLLLTGCSAKQAEIPGVSFAVCRDELYISLNDPAAPILEQLGAPFGYSESKSSTHRGVEKTYRFSGLNLRTYESDDGDRVMGVLLTDGTLSTAEGLRVGADANQVLACYGTQPDRLATACTVQRGGGRMTLLMKNGIVTGIQYALA